MLFGRWEQDTQEVSKLCLYGLQAGPLRCAVSDVFLFRALLEACNEVFCAARVRVFGALTGLFLRVIDPLQIITITGWFQGLLDLHTLLVWDLS